MIEHYSHKIQNAIQKELFTAKKSIKIAVAWFTNDLLFQPLLLKLAAGVTVELILNKDEINCSDENGIDFDEFVNAGGVLRWNDTKQLLHDNFCIIDDDVVIYGSYNWTNKAEYNEESIAISKGESSTTNFYIDKFLGLSKKYLQVERKIVNEPKEDIIKAPKSYEMELIKYALYYGCFPPESLIPCTPHELIPFTDYRCMSNLYFYDDININKENNLVIAKFDSFWFFVDEKTFKPIYDIEFTHIKRIDDIYPHKFWLKTNEKWGLYDYSTKKYVVPPIFDSFNYYASNEYRVFINDQHWRVNIYGKMLSDN